MKPVVDRLEKQYKGKVAFKRYDVEKDENGALLMQQFNAQYVPTFVFINADGSQAEVKVGELNEAALRKALDSLH